MNQAASPGSNSSQDSIFARLGNSPDVTMAVGIIAILAIMIVPLPAFMIDLLVTLGIAISIIMLATSINVKRALEFSAFPTMLLLVTLFRLSLNVATTRVILLRGSENGTAAAGSVIHAFGEFVVGGNYAVWLFLPSLS
jgi:flagellar biosynthesis protein FlhA